MCRHFAYLGPPRTLAELVLDPPHGLFRQSWQPRMQRHGVVNADGFGIGWYVADDPQPARYRRDRPIWSDANLADLARVIRTGAVLAAVRSGTDGMGHAESAAAPFKAGRWLFSHNGAVPGWPGSLAPLAQRLPAADLISLDAGTDSALLWAHTRMLLRRGAGLGDALADTVATAIAATAMAATGSARLNLLLTDGASIAATAVGDTLHWRADARSVTVASEPVDDDPAWRRVPDGSLLRAAVTPRVAVNVGALA